MQYFKKLVGDRIYLSPKGVSDEEIEKFTEWMNDFQVTDYTGRSGQITTLIGEKDYLENSAKSTENRNFNIIELSENKIIGTLGFEHINWIERSAILGIFIGDTDFRSNGYGTEAIRLLLEYGFKYLNLHSIRLDLLAINERAHKCYLKCGFKDTGRSREEIFLNGKYYDKLHMDILENEFEGDYIRNKNIKINLLSNGFRYTYNKLVRDKIPENIDSEQGRKSRFRILDDEEYLTELNKKVLEEANEFIEENSIEELGDLMEVLNAIIKVKGYNMEEIHKIMKEKEEKKGAFNNKIYLEYVDEERRNLEEEKELNKDFRK